MKGAVMVTNAAVEVEGRIENGRIVLDDPPAWREGARLHLRITVESEQERLERFLALAGSVPDLERPPQLELEVRESASPSSSPKKPRKLPPEFFELAGSIPDLERPSQGEYEVREPLS